MNVPYTRIPTYGECRDLVESNPAFVHKTEIVGEVPIASFNYRLASYGDFTSTPFARNMRGITFREDTEELLALPFWKFFNYGENPLTDPSDLKKLRISRVNDKLDGSLVYYYQVDGDIKAKTKMTTYSLMAQVVMNNNISDPDYLTQYIEGGMTLMVEYTSPMNQIVVPYQTTDFTCIGYRDMHTGELFEYEGDHFPRPIQYPDMQSLDEIGKFCDVYNNIDREGFVITLSNGDLVKMKTDRYRSLHRLKDTLSEKNIAYLTLHDGLDDMMELFSRDPAAMSQITSVSEMVRTKWNTVCSEAEAYHLENKEKPRKEYAMGAMNKFGRDSLQFAYAMNLILEKLDMSKLMSTFLQHEQWKDQQ